MNPINSLAKISKFIPLEVLQGIHAGITDIIPKLIETIKISK